MDLEGGPEVLVLEVMQDLEGGCGEGSCWADGSGGGERCQGGWLGRL